MTAIPALPPQLTIHNVGDLRAEWLAALADDATEGAVDVAADRVVDVDAAGVQLLVSLSQSLARRARGMRLVEPSAGLAAACAALGLSWLLADSAAMEMPE
ncbi:MAG: STAS domain-containing protein [Burkholderiaceae bacterium]